MSRFAGVLWVVASFLAILSAGSLAAYVHEGLRDDFPQWVLALLGFGALSQFGCAAWLAWRRSLRSSFALLGVSLCLATVEFGTFSGVLSLRDFLSTGSALVASVGIIASAIGSRGGSRRT